MKFYFRLFVAWLLLFLLWNLALTDGMSVSDFYSNWDSGPTSACYVGNKVVACNCTGGDAVRGCVREAKQYVWAFENPWDVQVRKLVYPTLIPWVFDVNVWVGWKPILQTVGNVCSVVVFDRSGSMKNWYNWGSATKRSDAVSWAIEFSNLLVSWNDNKVWLVFFAATATISTWLQNFVLSEDLFTGFEPAWNTNIWDWLVKAGNMLDWAEGCDTKYIVLMSDWDANLPTSSSVWPWKAKEKATELKNKWIIIYSIWYDIKSNSSAEKTLLAIAQDNEHYSRATPSTIVDKFSNIWSEVWSNAWTPYKIIDGIWWSFDLSWNNIEVPEVNQIIDPGTVYSFQIKIKPWMTWFQDSNSWLTLNYDDVDNIPQTLNIDRDHTAQIYWELPRCGWITPEWEAVITWAGVFAQNWVDWVLEPEAKEWSYTGSSTPWECEWTCWDAAYTWDTVTNTCKLKVTVNFDLNWWTWDVTPVVLWSWAIIDTGDVPDPSKTWYHLSWWTLSGEIFNIPWVVTEDITLKAEWEPNTYEIEYNWNGSTSWNMENQEIIYDTTWYIRPNVYEKDWYHFTWWNTQSNGSGISYDSWSEVKNLVTSWVITLYAQWEPNTYTVVFSWNGWNWTMLDQTFTYDILHNLNPNWFVKEWSDFGGWNTEPDGSGTWYNDGEEVKNLATSWTITLYAVWSINSYQIKYNWNWATSWSMVNQNLSYWATWNLSKNLFEKNWYHFTWWNTEEGGNGTWYLDEAEVKNLATTWVVNLYAQWEPNDYTIVFSWNGSTSWSMANQNMVYDTTWDLNPNVFEKNWYHFTWWNTNPDGTGTGYDDEEVVENLTTTWTIKLYAQWEPNKYIVVFSWNGATVGSMWNQQFTYDVQDNLNPNWFGKEWFNFVEWNTDKNGNGTGYANGALVKNLADTWVVTLYAQWNANTYEVEFNKNGSGVTWTMLNQTFPYGVEKKLTPNAFEKEWYHFTWWNTKEDGTGTWYVNEAEVKNLATTWVVKLYAQWEINVYTIIFDWNWASAWSMSWLQLAYNQEEKLTKNVYSNNGYKFLWWNTQADGKWTSYADEQTVKNLMTTTWEIRLYAQWEKLWTSWGGWWWGCKKDNCPDGDYSWDPCDGKCWPVPVPKPEKKPTPTPTPTPIISSKKCSIEGSKHSAEVNEAYIWACERWIISSNTIQGARLWEFLNRAEMAKIVTIFEVWELDARPNVNKDCSAFADSMAWYSSEMKNYMVTSCQLERMWIHTADHKPISDFMPRKFVSRAEFWTILSRILWWDRYEAEKNSKYYYVDHLNKLKDNWILTNIDPTLVERRSYAILMIYRAAKMMWKA